jgi:signal transduction histidine kinase
MHDTQTVDLNDVVEAAIESVHRTQLSDAVDIVWTRLPVAKVLGKPDELQQALFNVIRNAVQACGKHGVIRIGLEEHGDSVDVLVRDNGPGIPEEHRSKVFDPFFSTKGPDDGEGLGLYIVRQIVLRHGGDIQVTSGEGTTFTLSFPASPKTDRGETS